MYPSAGGLHSSEDLDEDVDAALENGRPGEAQVDMLHSVSQ